MPRINIDFTRSLLPLKQSSFVVPRLPHQLIAFKQFATVCIVLGTNEIRDFNFRIIHVSLLSAYCIIWHFRSLDCQRFLLIRTWEEVSTGRLFQQHHQQLQVIYMQWFVPVSDSYATTRSLSVAISAVCLSCPVSLYYGTASVPPSWIVR